MINFGRILALVVIVGVVVSVEGKCQMKPSYPPPSNTTLPWFTVNLDLPPQQRWANIVPPFSSRIEAMIDSVVDILPEVLRNELLQYIQNRSEEILNQITAPYGDEIRGIAQATNITTARMILYNVAYELMGFCTSIVAQDSNGKLFHGRNLDFGLFLGWDKINKTWQLTEKLRPLLFNAHFVEGGKIKFNATMYAGYVGLLTGMKTGGFSISVDTRFDNSFDSGLIKWLKGENPNAHLLTCTTRAVMENNATYDIAYQSLNNIELVGPAYIIVGGVQSGEGAVVTRDGSKSLFPYTLADSLKNGSYYVIETNYDHWVEPPFFDDRRTPAKECLAIVTTNRISFETLFNVLSGRPNLNLLTTYTTLMQVETGQYESYLQQCEYPCPFW